MSFSPLKLYQNLNFVKLTKGAPHTGPTPPPAEDPLPLLINPTLWPHSCLPMLSSCNPLPIHPNQREYHQMVSQSHGFSQFSFLLIRIFPIKSSSIIRSRSSSHCPSSGHHLFFLSGCGPPIPTISDLVDLVDLEGAGPC